MIWRLVHPVRGLAAAAVLWLLALLLIGFGIGTSELIVLLTASVGVIIAVGGRSKDEHLDRALTRPGRALRSPQRGG